MLKKPKHPELERDENGNSRLTHEFVQQLCEYNGQFYTPKCVDKLYLHFKGFERFEGLEQYTEVKAMWAESNVISEISGLDHMTQLKVLYLQSNRLTRMSGLTNLT